MNNGWFQKAVIIFLAIMTVFAFAPFVFSPPSSPQQQNNNTSPEPIREETNATSTATTSSAPVVSDDIPVGIKAPNSTSSTNR